MRGKTKIIIVSVIFFMVMLLFTVSARTIHNASLPRVTVTNLDYKNFQDKEVEALETEESKEEESKKYETSSNMMNGRSNLGIPKELYDNQKVYILSTEVINGEERSIAREVTNLVIGSSNDTTYEVIRGISGLDQVIVTGQESIQDGCEVYVKD